MRFVALPRCGGLRCGSDREIAAATGARPSTVRDWLNGRSTPTGTRAARLIELAEMTDRLRRVMDAEYIPSGSTGGSRHWTTTSPSSCSRAASTGASPS